MNHPYSASELADLPVQGAPAPFQSAIETLAERARLESTRLSRTERPDTPPQSIAEELGRPLAREPRAVEPTRA